MAWMLSPYSYVSTLDHFLRLTAVFHISYTNLSARKMSTSNASSLNGTSNEELERNMKGQLETAVYGKELWKDLEPELQQLLLRNSVQAIHESWKRMNSEARAKGDFEMMSFLVTSSVKETPSFVSYIESSPPVMTGIRSAVVLSLTALGCSQVKVESHILLAKFEGANLYNLFVDQVLPQAIAKGSTMEDLPFTLHEELRSFIQTNSLPGLDGCIQPMIDALKSHPDTLSVASTFDKVTHKDVQAVGFELIDVKDLKSSNPGTVIALTLRLLWHDQCDEIHRRQGSRSSCQDLAVTKGPSRLVHEPLPTGLIIQRLLITITMKLGTNLNNQNIQLSSEILHVCSVYTILTNTVHIWYVQV